VAAAGGAISDFGLQIADWKASRREGLAGGEAATERFEGQVGPLAVAPDREQAQGIADFGLQIADWKAGGGEGLAGGAGTSIAMRGSAPRSCRPGRTRIFNPQSEIRNPKSHGRRRR
jgi:hypothetical protein